MAEIIAIDTYGIQKVRDPHTGETISAFKLGYTTAARAVLLALYGNQARDVASKQATYHYLQITGEVTTRRSFLLLKVTEDELAQVETLTRQVFRPAVYCWRDGAWLELPSQRQSDYRSLAGQTGPSFNPLGLRMVSTTGEVESAATGILVEKSQRSPHDKTWFWLTGDTYPHRERLKQGGCRWSQKRKAWYFVGDDLPAAVQELIEAQVPPVYKEATPIAEAASPPTTLVDATPSDPLPTSESSPNSVPPSDHSETDAPKIRIIAPTDDNLPDAIQSAIQTVKTIHPVNSTIVLSAPKPGKPALAPIPQSFVGEVTGSISGHVWCYGYSIDQGVCVYLNCGGPRMSVEAIRAKLSKGDTVTVVPWDAPAVELTAGEGNTGKYHDYFANIPEARFTSLILLHEAVVQPNYGGKSTTYLLYISDEQIIGQLHQHIACLVKIPVFATWATYLWTAGQAAMLIRKTRGEGGLSVYAVDLDIDSWTRLVTGGLTQQIIRLPS